MDSIKQRSVFKLNIRGITSLHGKILHAGQSLVFIGNPDGLPNNIATFGTVDTYYPPSSAYTMNTLFHLRAKAYMVISIVHGSDMDTIFNADNWIMSNLRPLSGPILEFFQQNMEDAVIIKGNNADEKCQALSDIFSKQIPTPLLKLLEDCKDAHPATSWNYCGDVEMKQPYQLPEWRLGAPTKGMDNNCLGMPTSFKESSK